MTGRPLLAAASGSSAQPNAPAGNQKQPERPGGKPKRTLIESACAACRKRKSRCDGARPSCSRCQALQTECIYQAEEGESRWSALRRKNHTLEKERNQTRELIALIQSQPEPESQEIYRQIRQDIYGGDIGAFVRQIREGTLGTPAPRRYSLPHQQQQQLMPQPTFAMPASGPGPQQPELQTQLPPLRSVVELPPLRTGQVPQPPPATQRNHSLTSARSDGSYSSMSSGDLPRSSISPRDLPHGWS